MGGAGIVQVVIASVSGWLVAEASLSPALALIVSGAVATVGPPAQADATNSGASHSGGQIYGPPIPAAPPQPKPLQVVEDNCKSSDPGEIVVCAEKPEGYRIDPTVMEAQQQAEAASRSANAIVPTAQASCSASPSGCGTGLEGLDLLNVAVVVGTMAVRAAKGDDWTKAFKTGGPDEYQLYKEAKQRREAHHAEREAAAKNGRRLRFVQ